MNKKLLSEADIKEKFITHALIKSGWDEHTQIIREYSITTEFAWINVDVPSTYSQQFGSKQQGGFIDIVQPILNRTMLGWEKATLNVACRLEYVDWNVGRFNETNGNIGEHVWSIMPAISFRPTSQTVIRLNYRLQKQTDIFGNPPSITDGYSLGISTYF